VILIPKAPAKSNVFGEAVPFAKPVGAMRPSTIARLQGVNRIRR
jgi:hypothetical protein